MQNSFNFTVKYLPGHANADADGLSRILDDFDGFIGKCADKLSKEVIGAVFEGAVTKRVDTSPLLSAVALRASTSQEEPDKLPTTIRPFPLEEIRKAQKDDPVIGQVLKYKTRGEHPGTAAGRWESREVRMLLREWPQLQINEDNLLIRKSAQWSQLVLPNKYKLLVYRELHKKMGHLGSGRTLDLIRERFFWPEMQQEIERYMTKECECLKKKKPARITRAPRYPSKPPTHFSWCRLTSSTWNNAEVGTSIYWW